MSSTSESKGDKRPGCVLVSVQLPDTDDEEHAASIAELGRLVHTLGYEVVGVVTQKRATLAPSAVLGEGKLEELAAFTGGTGVVPVAAKEPRSKARARFEHSNTPRRAERVEDANGGDDEEGEGEDEFEADEAGDEGEKAAGRAQLVAVDHELSPSQVRNLERAAGCDVLDRNGVIVEIFHRHARSREARLQVEIARLTYLSPRVRETGGDRVRGGVGGKGTGESALELDRRKVRDRIAELREELARIEKEQDTRRARRSEALRVALVGYTNAGKSSLMRALTGSEVYVADKLFATLDTTVRALHPASKPPVLVSDTVGFIKKLPHDLVASFRSTLDEALEASLLLYVVDASDPTFRSQLAVTRSVLDEIGAGDVPSKLVLNKTDRLTQEQKNELLAEYPNAVLTSAHTPDAVRSLRDDLVAFFEKDLEEAVLFVPYKGPGQGLIGELHERARVLSEDYEENNVRFRVKASPDLIARWRATLSR